MYLDKTILKSDWLRIDNTDRDDHLDRIIAHVESEIEDICNQPIEQKTLAIKFAGNNRDSYQLHYLVPVAVSAVQTRQTPGDAWETLTGTEVSDVGEGAFLFRSTGFSNAEYSVTLSVGYTPVALIPQSIVRAGYEMCKELFLETPYGPEVDRFGVSAISESEAGVSISKGLLNMRDQNEKRLAKHKAYGGF